MALNSIQYLVFLTIIFFLYQWVPVKQGWLVLLISSFIFYASLKSPPLVLALVLVIFISYFFGRLIKALEEESKKRLGLFIGVGLNVLVLLTIKYLPTLTRAEESLGSPLILFNGLSIDFNKLAPIGVSFFTFQAISYLIDIYLEIIEPEYHLGYFALSLSFFPKLLQGPIERSGKLIPQLKQPFYLNYQNVRDGLLQIGWGLFNKVVIADRLALFVNPVFNNVDAFSGVQLIITIYLYALQIYFDFYAYTEIALGSARVFNIMLTPNFNLPYLAESVTDFWRRWHITFSQWIQDYIFKPLQMNWRRYKSWGTIAAVLLTFLVSGIWHGVGWGFIIWGGLHGLFMAVEILLAPIQKKKNIKNFTSRKWVRVAKIILTFNLVSFSWIFFRAKSLADAFYIVNHLFISPLNNSVGHLQGFLSLESIIAIFKPLMMGQSKLQVVIFLVILMVYGLMLYLSNRQGNRFHLAEKSPAIRWAFYYGLIIITIFFGVYDQSQFIYFQF